MQPGFLFRNDEIFITEYVARFAAISYQISNIDRVGVYYDRKLNGFAITLFSVGLVAIFSAYLVYQDPRLRDYVIYVAGAAAALIILGVLWQQWRPVYEYKFVMRTSSGDEHSLISRDKNFVFDVKSAIERAFTLQGLAKVGEPARPASPTV
jgi:hypothetical protein